MTRNLKALGLALLAICALGAMAAQAASAHQFKSQGNTVLTGANVGTEKFAVGTAGTVECAKSEFEATQEGTEADELTVTPRYSGCTFGGQPATVKFNHCAYEFDSDTTVGNADGGEHANVAIECELGSRIEIVTSVCTITIGGQLVKHAVTYEPDTAKSVIVKSTAKKVVTGKEKQGSQTGCTLFPTGAIGTYTGTSTVSCKKDEGSALSGTEKTTPQGVTKEGEATNCSVS